MVDIDTSSYPRAAPVAQQNPLDTVGKLQEMQQRSIGIDKSKLDLVNQKWGMNSKILGELTAKGLVEPLTPKDSIDAYREMLKYGGKTPEQFAQSVSSLPTLEGIKRQNPNATPEQQKQFLHEKLMGLHTSEQLRGASIMEALNAVHGTPDMVDTGQTKQGVVTSPLFGVKPRGAIFQNQLPVSTPVATPSGTQALGPQPQMPPQGGSSIQPNRIQTVPAPRLPIGAMNPSEAVNPQSVGGQPQNLTGPIITPRGPMLSQPPAFEEGKKQYSEDINQASQTLQALKPAQQALKLMNPEVIKGLTGTGPIAEKATKILSALQGIGLLNESDPVAARQELTKKLAQYVGNNPIGQRSDAAQTLKEAGSPNPNVQVLPALINLTRDSIALDRVNAAKSLAFNDKDFSKYLQHKGSFANSIDERAFKLDVMDEKEREQLRERIKGESKIKQEKFKQSVELAKRLKMYE